MCLGLYFSEEKQLDKNLLYMRFKLQTLIPVPSFLFQCLLLLFLQARSFYYFALYCFVITGGPFFLCLCVKIFVWNTIETGKWEWRKLKHTIDH